MTDGPLIVQSDKTVLLEVDHEQAGAARAAIAPFAELERAPEHIHTYRITPLALWNARAAGHDAEQVVDALVTFSRYAVPQPLLVDIVDTMARYGRLQLVKSPVHGLMLVSLDRAVLAEVLRNKKITPMLGARIDDDSVVVHPSERGRVKQMLLKIGWPAEDLAGYVNGEAHAISLVQADWELRDYQQMAVDSFWAGGSGVVVLPRNTAPHSLRRATLGASWSQAWFLSTVREPRSVGQPRTSSRSLISVGTPSTGPCGSPFIQRFSLAFAWVSASSGRTATMALNVLSCRSIWARQLFATSTGENFLRA